MAVYVKPPSFRDIKSLSSTEGGFAVTTSVQRAAFPRGAKWLSLAAREFTTAEVVRWNLCPWLVILKTTDGLATKTNMTDYSDAAQDSSTATDIVLSGLDTLANGDALYFGSWMPFRGIAFDIDAANANASVMSGTYWNGSAWTDLSVTDSTASGGATFATDATVSWTVPSDWAQVSLVTASSAMKGIGLYQQEMYWARLVVSAALDASTTLNSAIAVTVSEYSELRADQIHEQTINVGIGGVAGLTYLTAAGTASLIANIASDQRMAN